MINLDIDGKKFPASHPLCLPDNIYYLLCDIHYLHCDLERGVLDAELDLEVDVVAHRPPRRGELVPGLAGARALARAVTLLGLLVSLLVGRNNPTVRHGP